MDSGWIKALELPAKITGGVFIACGLIWYLDGNDTIKLEGIGPWLRPVIMIIWIVSGSLFGMSIVVDIWKAGVDYLQKRSDKKEKANEKAAEIQAMEARREATVAHLDCLSEKENFEAAKALKGNSPSFESWAYSTGAGQLKAKGLIYSPQGTYHDDNFPFTFYDFVWDALQERRESILKREAEYELARKRRR